MAVFREAIRINQGSASATAISPIDGSSAEDRGTGLFFPATNTVAIATAGTEAARLTNAQRLILGSSLTVPTETGYSAAKFTSLSNDNDIGINLVHANSSAATPPIYWYKSRGTLSAKTAVVANDPVAVMLGAAYESTTPSYTGIGQYVMSVENITGATVSGYHSWFTRNSSNVWAERMRLNSAGTLSLGTPVSGSEYGVWVTAASTATTFTTGYPVLSLLNTQTGSGSSFAAVRVGGDNGTVNAFLFADGRGTAAPTGNTVSAYVGTTTNHPMYIVSNAARRVMVPGAGGMVVGFAALATSATDGFLYIPSCAGIPSGVPTAQSGTVPIVYDTTNNRIYAYNGAWRQVAVT